MGEIDRIAVVVLCVSLFSFPLYVAILIVVTKSDDFKSSFYKLIVNQGLYDLASMVNYFVFFSLRGTEVYADFFWNFQTGFVPLWMYVCVYFFLYLRVIGVIVITFNRFVACIFPFSPLNNFFQNTPQWMFLVGNLLAAVLLAAPTMDHTAQFDSKQTMNPRQNTSNFARNTLMGASFAICSAVVCFIAYMAIIVRVFGSRKLLRKKSEGLERNAIVQLSSILFAFGLVAGHNLIVFVQSFSPSSVTFIESARALYPLWSMTLSYVSAWTMLIINSTLRRRLLGVHSTRASAKTSVQLTTPTNQTQRA